MALFLFKILGYYYEIPSIGAIRINTQVSMLVKSSCSDNTKKRSNSWFSNLLQFASVYTTLRTEKKNNKASLYMWGDYSLKLFSFISFF